MSFYVACEIPQFARQTPCSKENTATLPRINQLLKVNELMSKARFTLDWVNAFHSVQYTPMLINMTFYNLWAWILTHMNIKTSCFHNLLDPTGPQTQCTPLVASHINPFIVSFSVIFCDCVQPWEETNRYIWMTNERYNGGSVML